MMKWGENIENFISLANQHQVKMIMIGGGAVNFHGYQRHSADVDFWIDVTKENMHQLKMVFQKMGYEIEGLCVMLKENKLLKINTKG